jgi:hypothetical protein
MWNYVVTKKVLNTSKYILYLRFFKVATLALMTALHSLNQLHLECFFNSLERVPTSFNLRSNSSQTISIGLRSGDFGGQVI